MLAQIKMEIEASGLNTNMGSLFHGYLMSVIDTAYAEYFHHNTTNPYTSCIYRDRESKKFFWRITTFNKNAFDMIISYFLENDIKTIFLENKDLEVTVKSLSLNKTSFEELYLNANKKNKINLISPTSFKSEGVTHIFPNIRILLAGVIAKINQHSDSVKLEDEKIVNEFLDRVYIYDYNLKTQAFHLEKIKIKGFIGSMNIAIKGEDSALNQILNFLIMVSEYTGLGIKTSLGMGGVKIDE